MLLFLNTKAYINKNRNLLHLIHNRVHCLSITKGINKLFTSTSSNNNMNIPQSTKSISNERNIAVHVKGKVSSNYIDSFYKASLKNARNSILESGISRFDLLRNIENTEEFLLIEVYKNVSDIDKHKLADHYLQWKKDVEPWMNQPRSSSKYITLYPSKEQWNTMKSSYHNIDITNHRHNFPWDINVFTTASTTTTSSSRLDGNKVINKKSGLLAVVVNIQIKSGKENEITFIKHTIDNCKASLLESGVHRFDFMQDLIDPSKFVLVEIYNSKDAPQNHKNTIHYKQWASFVVDLMQIPRSSSRYMTLYPSPLYYHKSSSLNYPGEGQYYLTNRIEKEKEEVLLHKTQLLKEKIDETIQVSTTTNAIDISWEGRKGLSTASPAMFMFQSPPKIVMGRGIAASAIKSAMTNLKMKVPLIITGASGISRHEDLWKEVFPPIIEGNNNNNSYDYRSNMVQIKGEPTIEDITSFVALAVKNNCDSVLSIGGGSSIDAGKAVSALIPNNHRSIYDFLEVVGKGLPLDFDPLPFIAVPTTSGTGSEATKNAVLKSTTHGLKCSIRHELMYPKVAILDPMLTISCSPTLTADVGLDTLCQVIEPYVSNSPNPFVDAFAKEGIVRAARSLRNAVSNGAIDIEAREDLSIASVMSGLCLANAKLGIVHGFAAVLGGKYDNVPHGAICACLLPYVFDANVQALQATLTTTSSSATMNYLSNPIQLDAIIKLSRFQDVARMITGNPTASIEDGIDWLHALMKDIDIPSLSSLCPGITDNIDNLDSIIQSTLQASSSKGNPIILSKEQLKNIILKAL